MSGNVKGILWMVAAVCTLTVMAVTLKHVVQTISPWQASWLRMVFGVAFLLPWVIRNGASSIMSDRLPLLIARGVFGTGSFALTIYTLRELILADAVVLSFTTPFWVIPLAALMLGEMAGWRRALVTAVGFGGVILVVKPQFGIETAMIIALVAAVLRAFVVVFIKDLVRTEAPRRVVFWFFATGMIVLAGPALTNWTAPSAAEWAWILLAAIAGWIGQEFLSRAYREGEATVISPIEFGRVPLAAVIGFAIFSEVPDLWTAAGTVVIVGAAWAISRTRATAGGAS